MVTYNLPVKAKTTRLSAGILAHHFEIPTKSSFFNGNRPFVCTMLSGVIVCIAKGLFSGKFWVLLFL